MAVFLRHRFAGGVKTTIWKKYSVAYSGTVSNVQIWRGQLPSSKAQTLYYYDGFDFPLSGDPTLGTEHSVNVNAATVNNANILKGKIFIRSNQYYFGTNDDATRGTEGRGSNQYYYVRKKGIPVTAETARSLAIAGDYIEDVESEDPNAYPDNGPLGLYFYIKQ